MKYLVFVIISVVSSCFASINAQVAEAAEAMNNKDYPKAIAIYNSILEAGQTSGELHYNLGLAHAELQEIGYALWHFQKANVLGLDSESLSHNIQLVEERRKDEIEVIPEFFLSKWWDTWKSLCASNTWSILALLAVFLGVFGLYTWRTADNRNRRKQGFTVGVPLILFAIICFLSANSLSNDRNAPSNGVLLTKSFELRAAPDLTSAKILTIHEGIDVKVQDQIAEWIKVRLANGQTGWILIKDVGLF